MGALAKALSPPSSKSAKEAGLWAEIVDLIDGCILPAQLEEVEAWVAARELQIPARWWEPISDRLALKREEFASEDVGSILRDRFDF